MASEPRRMRILAVSNQWQGANDYAFVRAFRRMGHSVRVVNPKEYTPSWRSRPMSFVRRVLTKRIADEFKDALVTEALTLRPDLLFVFKGAMVTAEMLREVKSLGVVCIQFYPDTGFDAQSPFVREAVPEYDWFFTTKSAHVPMLKAQMGYDRTSFLPHGYDPETHRPVPVDARDEADYACDVSFIGNISAKKAGVLETLLQRVPGLDLRIWGPKGWARASPLAARCYQGHPIFGDEFSKAIGLSKINLGLLFEGNKGAEPDTITSRSFHIPAAGGFLLHERTEEAQDFFLDGTECAFFHGADELVEKIRYYLDHEAERQQVAAAGRARSLASGYSIEDRARTVVAKFLELSRDPARSEVQP